MRHRLSAIAFVSLLMVGCSSAVLGERVVERYESGQKKSEGHVLYDGTAVGFWTSWHENGQKAEQVTFNNGERDGVLTEWDENGVKTQVLYLDGKEVSNS